MLSKDLKNLLPCRHRLFYPSVNTFCNRFFRAVRKKVNKIYQCLFAIIGIFDFCSISKIVILPKIFYFGQDILLGYGIFFFTFVLVLDILLQAANGIKSKAAQR